MVNTVRVVGVGAHGGYVAKIKGSCMSGIWLNVVLMVVDKYFI